MQKLRVGVLMGGKSQEREVSFNSGRTVCDHLDTCRYEIIPIFQTENGNLFLLPWHFLHRGKTNDFRHRLENEAKLIKWDDLKSLVDFVFIAMHGQFAEDGTVQGFLEILDIPYLGSKVFGSAIGMNKIIQKEFLRANGIEVAKGIAVYPYQIINFEKYKTEIFAALEKAGANPPFIIKPHKEGSSLGVEAVLKTEDLHSALKRASCVNPESEQPVLIEEKIKGMEVSCCVITDYKTGKLIPLTPTEIVIDKNKHFHDYKEKYMPGLGYEHTPARCNDSDTELIKKTCVRVMDILKIENIGRVDGFLTEDKRFIVIDPNTLTGMGPSSFFFREAAEDNINHTQLINHVIETELNNYGLLEKIINHEEKVKEEANMTSKKIRVAILMGGTTNEREISFESGRNITYKLSPQKYSTIPVFVDKNMELYKINNKHLVRKSTHEVQDLLSPELKINWNDLPTIADFVFIALHGGQGENGCVQGTLEMLGMPYNGSSVLASALCANKFETNKFLESQGFTVPASVLVAKEDFLLDKTEAIKNILAKLDLPIILKPHDDGCSTMVCKIKDAQELEASLTEFFTTNKHIAMAEEEIIGMELTVGVIGNNQPIALPPSQAVATKGILSIEEKFLPGAGENQTPAPLPQEALKLVQQQMELAYSALGCAGYVRIDCFYQSAEQSKTKQERVIFLEVNTLPGMTPATCIFHQAAEIGIRPMDFIDLIIELGLEKHKNISCKHNLFKDTNKQEHSSIRENSHENY
ncbi:MAG: ATP-grasp enzyme, D-alanine-D-alanine ligase [candidate division TM6 bacterium GW2011_GWF2_30_66]|nr:MAG: ATP-grasp enzyme, D-alanine-D-alanine ligase [candidate division TM6 bacterium GW2011_GWF2_30_66]